MSTHKETAVSFLRTVAAGKVRDAYEQFVSPDFRHHNAYYRGDRESLMRGMEENAATFPHKSLDVLRALDDGDLVAVHSRVRPNPGDLGAVVVHIFRFENGRIAELWDVGQAIPKDTPNENGLL